MANACLLPIADILRRWNKALLSVLPVAHQVIRHDGVRLPLSHTHAHARPTTRAAAAAATTGASSNVAPAAACSVQGVGAALRCSVGSNSVQGCAAAAGCVAELINHLLRPRQMQQHLLQSTTQPPVVSTKLRCCFIQWAVRTAVRTALVLFAFMGGE